MKLLALSIGVLGAAQATLWAWAPQVVRWQTLNTLDRYQATETVDVAMRVFQESMWYTYIESGSVGAIMVLASALLLKRSRLGWNLWVLCLIVAVAGAVLTTAVSGVSVGFVMRLVLLSAFVVGTVQTYRSDRWANWFAAGVTE